MRRSRWHAVVPGIVGLLLATVLAADAAVAPIDSGAGGMAPAVAVFQPKEAVSITQVLRLTPATIEGSFAAADDAGAAAVLGDGFQLGLTHVYRGADVVLDTLGPGWRFPVSVNALPNAAISALIGRDVSSAVGGTSVVMAATSAAMHHVQAGDVIEVYANDGSLRWLSVGLVVPDATVGGTEILMNIDQAMSLGSNGAGRVLIWGAQGRAAIDNGLLAHGVLNDVGGVRIRRTWDPPDPDSTIGLLSTKVQLGEMQYRMIDGSDNVVVDDGWIAAHLPANLSAFLNGYVHDNCNLAIRADLQAALDEVDAAGLTAALRGPYWTSSIGGCFAARFNRNTPSDYLGSLSRHTFAQAMDINWQVNCQGCVPTMNCDVVRIFRKHNFAWGGNFARPDGMHFEWVGTPRDQLQSPSRFCPNVPLGGTQTSRAPPPAGAGLAALFVDDVTE